MKTGHLTHLTRWERMMVEYGFYHQSSVNMVMHFIGIPVIFCSVLIPLSWITFASFHFGGVHFEPCAAWLAVLLIFGFYYSLDKQLAMLSIAFMLPALLIAKELSALGIRTSAIIAAAGFFGGYALQFAGHALEGKKPALAAGNPLRAMLTAPLFVVAEVASKFGFREEMFNRVQQEITGLEAAALKNA